MTKQEFSDSLAIARSSLSLENIDDYVLFGCGLPDFRYPVYVTREQVAKLIRWQCCSIFSNSTVVDGNELNDLAHIARRKFQII